MITLAELQIVHRYKQGGFCAHNKQSTSRSKPKQRKQILFQSKLQRKQTFLRPMHKGITLSSIDSNSSSCSPAYGMHHQSQPEAEGDPAPQPPLPQLPMPQDSLGRFLVRSFIARASPFWTVVMEFHISNAVYASFLAYSMCLLVRISVH